MTQPHLTRRGLLGLGAGLAAGAALPARGAAPTELETFYVVRHAEKGPGNDPPLTDAGAARAAQLALVLRDVPLRAVYSTDTLRTRSTALPTAQARSLEVKIYEAAAARQTLAGEPGPILVVGHADTVPGLLRALGADFATEELGGHDDLFLVVRPPAPDAPVLLQHLHYGAVSSGGHGMR